MAYSACELAKMRPVSILPVDVYHSENNVRFPTNAPVSWDLANLLKTRWNPTTNAANAIRWVMFRKDTLGEAYVRIEWGERNGYQVPIALWPLWGNVTTGWDDTQRKIVYEYSGDDLTPQGKYLDREIIVFRSALSADTPFSARSLADACAAAIHLDIDLFDFYQKMISNGTHFPRWLETDNHLTNSDLQELKDSMAGTAGLLPAGKLRIFQNGLRVKQSTASMVDLALLEESRWVLQRVCSICGVPPNEVYDNSQLTYSGNVEMSAIQFSSKTLMPECRELETVFDGVLRSAGLFDDHVKFDMSGLQRGNYKERMQGYQIGVFTGFYTVNEVRAWEDLPPVNGGDCLMWPTNYYQRDESGELLSFPPKQEPETQPGGTGQAGNMPSSPDKALAENTFHEPMLARIRERVADTGDTKATRAFAAKVLAPWANFCLSADIPYDIESEIEGLMK